MKVFITADLEGITGVTSWDDALIGHHGYESARKQMNRETAAACQAAIDLGYEVVVKDGHDTACNLQADMLPEGVQLISGWLVSPYGMMAGLDETFDAVIYIGYHSPEGTDTSPLAHTTDPDIFNWVNLNGRLASEFTLNKVVADMYKVPSVFLSGDKGMCVMAKNEVPDIITVPTKDAVGNATWNMDPRQVETMIYEGVSMALKNRPVFRDEPLDEFRITMNFKKHSAARKASWFPGAKQLDSRTVEYIAKTPEEMRVAQMFMTGL